MTAYTTVHDMTKTIDYTLVHEKWLEENSTFLFSDRCT